MKEVSLTVAYKELKNADELPDQLRQLLVKAKEAVAHAYAPYSDFKVGAAALLENGTIITGSNQENASSPVGICAERVTLSAASSSHPETPIAALAVSAKTDNILHHPVTPCGLCRQTLLEYEERFGKSIQLILQGEDGPIIWLASSKLLLPLYFSSEDLSSDQSHHSQV